MYPPNTQYDPGAVGALLGPAVAAGVAGVGAMAASRGSDWWSKLGRTAAAIAAHPLTATVLGPIISVTTTWLVTRSTSGTKPKDDTALKKLDELQARLEALERELDGQPNSVGSSETKSASVTPVTTNGAGEASGSASVSVACIPCARAHLVGVAAELDEATRFIPDYEQMLAEWEKKAKEAKERGEAPPPKPTVMDHPEIGDRVRFAAREIVSLERRDWSPDRVMRNSPEAREIVMRYRPKVRDLRQQILNGIRTPDDLMRVAAQANELWSRFEQESRPLLPPDSPDGDRLMEAARAFAQMRRESESAPARDVREEAADVHASPSQQGGEEHGRAAA